MEIDQATGEILDERDISRVPFLRSAYNYDTDLVSQATGLVCNDPTRAQQQFKDETDINTIVRNFGLTGELPKDVAVPQYADLVDAPTDYQTALNLVLAGQAAFAEMPAEVRSRFGNDPGAFVDFANDPANKDEARRLGLLVPESRPPEPVKVIVQADPAADTKPAS